MSVRLNHTFVHSSDVRRSARYFADVLGLDGVDESGYFLAVRLSNEVLLEFVETPAPITAQHYAFLVSDAEFDEIHGRIVAAGQPFWAYPMHQGPGRLNDWAGGRGCYFDDPDGHALEIMTRTTG
ncbi:VOC family protein [Actinoplanes sp. NPDC049802]|uniref:VOC family protein n=1 Tax=Actinoplanes sp. NPDC049802 TaxID=3154742 RepID=UPI00340D2E5C